MKWLYTLIIPFCVLTLLFVYGPALWFQSTLIGAQYSDDFFGFYLDSQAVVYGKVRAVTPSLITLHEVYTFQTTTIGDSSTNTLQAQELNPLTRPEEGMTLNRDRVMFFEKIGPRARILELIDTL